MIVSMLASSSRAIVSSRRCCWVLAISDGDAFPLYLAGLQEPSRLHGLPVAVAELALAEVLRGLREDREVGTVPEGRPSQREGVSV